MPIKIFFCYADEDKALLKKLITHLKLLQQQGVIHIWKDGTNFHTGGVDWEEVDILTQLESAQIILLLISPNFIASDYCYSIEMKRAMERHNLNEACVIPIILSPCDWKSAPFGKLQALPKNAKPITKWDDREAAFNNIVDNIRIVVNGFSNLGDQTMLYRHSATLRVAFCNTVKDEAIMNELEDYLRPLIRQALISIWHGGMIRAGAEWQREIDSHLGTSDIILLFVSRNFLNSDFISAIELPKAMRRYQAGEARVIPIILSPCDWKSAPFSELQALPKNAKPITEWDDHEAAFNNIVDNIRMVVEEITLQQHTKQLLNTKASLMIETTKTVPQDNQELERIEVELEAAFEKKVSLEVQKELANRTEQTVEKQVITESEQIRKTESIADVYAIVAAITSGCVLIAVFEFCIHWFQWKWLLLHQNSYGIQVGFDVLLVFLSFCLFGLLRVNQRRRRLSGEELTYLGILVAVLAILTAILVGTFQLLGGQAISTK